MRARPQPQTERGKMSLSSINAVLSDRSTNGVYRLAMLAIADCAGEASVAAIQKWVNCDEPSAGSILDDLVNMGLVSEEYDDDFYTVKYWSQWLNDLTYGPAPSTRERSRYIPASVRAAVFDRDGDKCQYCGAVDVQMHIDHVVPFSKGGSNDIENLTVACASCNLSKRDKTIEEWRGFK